MDLYQRPQYHFQPLANWMNDPNGLIHWQGQYHLFYQHNPNGPQWAQMHWGHAVSPDLVHWRHLPMALAPTPGGPDKDGVFSGCAIDHDGVPTLVYTGVNPQVQCLATSQDMIHWCKHRANPVLAAPPEGIPPKDFRDPFLWREANAWYAAIGSSTANDLGIVLLYRTQNLLDWEYVGPLAQGESDETGRVWECPNFLSFGERHALIISPIPLGRAIYLSGVYQDHVLQVEGTHELDPGGALYAPQVMVDAQGRHVLFGWLWERRDNEAQVEAGWAGVQSLPRILNMGDDGKLTYRPAPEVRQLRGDGWHGADIALQADVPWTCPLGGDTIEIVARFGMGGASRIALELRRAEDGSEVTTVACERDQQRLSVDTSRSSSDTSALGDRYQVQLEADDTLTLRLFLDRSVLELFADDRACLSSRIYPHPESLGLRALASGGDAELLTIDVYPIRSIWSL